MVKKVLVLILIIFILIGVNGCMKTKRVYSLDEKRDIVLAYLKEKYGEEFVAKSMIGSDWSQSYDEIYLYPKKGSENDLFVVRFSARDDGTYHLSDGYFGILIKDKYEAVMSGFVKEIYKDFKLYTDFGSGITYSDRLNKNTKICEIYNKNERFYSNTFVYVKQSSAQGIDVEEELERIAQKMVENEMTGSIKIYVILDEKYELASIDTKNHRAEFMKKENLFQAGKDIDVNQDLKIEKYGR